MIIDILLLHRAAGNKQRVESKVEDQLRRNLLQIVDLKPIIAGVFQGCAIFIFSLLAGSGDAFLDEEPHVHLDYPQRFLANFGVFVLKAREEDTSN